MNYADLDPMVIPLVDYFNSHGLKTFMSCQGHNKTNMSMFWISFDADTTEEDIIKFQRDHSDIDGCFRSCGRLVKRYIAGRGGIWSRFEYNAATLEAARRDLLHWKEARENRSKIDSGEEHIVKAE